MSVSIRQRFRFAQPLLQTSRCGVIRSSLGSTKISPAWLISTRLGRHAISPAPSVTERFPIDPVAARAAAAAPAQPIVLVPFPAEALAPAAVSGADPSNAPATITRACSASARDNGPAPNCRSAASTGAFNSRQGAPVSWIVEVDPVPFEHLQDWLQIAPANCRQRHLSAPASTRTAAARSTQEGAAHPAEAITCSCGSR